MFSDFRPLAECLIFTLNPFSPSEYREITTFCPKPQQPFLTFKFKQLKIFPHCFAPHMIKLPLEIKKFLHIILGAEKIINTNMSAITRWK